MSKTSDVTLPLEPQCFYHLFNRGNKGIKIFYQERNYEYFLKKFSQFLSSYLDTYTYALIPNHFHFLVKIKSTEEIFRAAATDYHLVSKSLKVMLKKKIEGLPIGMFREDSLFLDLLSRDNQQQKVKCAEFLPTVPIFLEKSVANWIVSDCLRRFLGGYARAINIQEEESGSLFQKNFKRILVDSEVYFTALVWYMHNNGVHHGLCENFKDYAWTSYHRVLIERPTKLKKKELLAWFGGRTEYVKFHAAAKVNWDLLNKVVVEEDGLLSF